MTPADPRIAGGAPADPFPHSLNTGYLSDSAAPGPPVGTPGVPLHTGIWNQLDFTEALQ